MRIAIVTLPLHTNYGGLLQAYALKHCLEGMGHDVTVLDRKVKMPLPAVWKAPFIYMKRLIQGKPLTEVFRERWYKRDYPIFAAHVQPFTDRYIRPRVLGWYNEIKEGEYDAFIIGSDQVWRPLYFGRIEDAFLAFTKDWDVVRMSYAASFGTDNLEFEYETVRMCTSLLQRFDAVSVREDSAVAMCSEWLDCDRATHVLDPVMLLASEEYKALASDASGHPCKDKVVTYILDRNSEKQVVVDFMSKVSGCEVADLSVHSDLRLPAEKRVVPPVEDWLAGFMDARCVVTDSFHGCVLSILFHKPFVAVGNSRRGMTRLESLLGMFGLDMRLVQGIDPEDDGEFFLSDPDWDAVDAVLETERMKSMRFLEEGLRKS